MAHTPFLSCFFQSLDMSLLLKRLPLASALSPTVLRPLCMRVICMFTAPVDGKMHKSGSSASPVVSTVLALDAGWTTGGCLGLVFV